VTWPACLSLAFSTLFAVALESAPIQLLNLSVQQLRRLTADENIKVNTTATKADLIRALVDNLSRPQLEDLAADYLYAGRTSVAWLHFDGGALDPGQLRRAIVAACDGLDPYAADLRPPLVPGEPKLLHAREWRDDKVVLTFGLRGRERLIFEGWAVREVSEDIALQAVVRLGDAVFEVRSSHLHVQMLSASFASRLTHELGRSLSALPIDQAAFDALSGTVGARLDGYTGLDPSPSPYGTRSVTKKAAVVDLAAEPAFQQDYGGLDAVKGEIEFDGPDGEVVKALVAMRTGSVYFRSMASEGAIDTVYAALRAVWF
jgi:hypothetical protein